MSWIGDVSDKGDVSRYMTADIDGSSQVRIVMLIVLIFPINALSHGRLKKIRKHEHDEVEHILMLIVVTKVKEVKREYLLQHVMEQIIISVLIKSWFDFDLQISNADETHHIASVDPDDFGIIGVEDITAEVEKEEEIGDLEDLIYVITWVEE